MSRGPEKFYTPPSFSVPPAPEPMKLARQRPQKLRFSDRLSTPNIAVMIRSPNISPIPATSIRSLDFDSPHLKPNNGGALKRGMGGGSGEIDRLMEASFNTTSFVSPMEKSFRCPLNDHLDLKLVLKDYDLAHLVPIFESKSMSIAEISEMTEQDFINMGIFKLNELDKLKRICNLMNDSQNTSY